MNRIVPFLLATAVLSGAGCGNYSKDDLLFFSAIPELRDVSLQPPGVDDARLEAATPGQTTQALDACTENTLRCQAQNIAGGLNDLTFGLLAIIDNIMRYPPSQRSSEERVWGPIYLQDQNASFRFAMRRLDDGDEPRYAHCLHFANGDVGDSANDIGCDEARHDSGMLRVLSGEFIPGVRSDAAARSGAGQLLLEADHLKELDPNQDIEGTFDIVYDNFGGTQAISIDIEAPGSTGAIPDTAEYTYALFENGAGEFAFVIKADINGDFFSTKETYAIESRWNASQAGRATAKVSGGDLPDGLSWDVDECWNEQLETVYYRDPEPNNPDVGADDSVCALTAP